MNKDLLKVYAENHLRPFYNYAIVVSAFLTAKIYLFPAFGASSGFSFLALSFVIAAGLALLALANERRIYRDILMDKPGSGEDGIYLAIAASKLFYVVPWLVFLFYPLQSDFVYHHLVGHFFVFCAIAAYGSASPASYPLFVWDIGLQMAFAGLITYLNHGTQESTYIGGATLVFGLYMLLSGHKTTQTMKELVESRRQIGESAARAEKAHKTRTDFLSVMSHEIRTPMAGILGMVDFLRETKLSPEQKNCLETITQCSRTLLNTLNDVLDISREESGNPVIRQINYSLDDVLKNTVQAMQHTAGKKGLVLEYKPDGSLPREMSGDPYRVQQIVFNLLNNAVKFTEKGSVTLSAAMGSDDMMMIEVRDTGIGIGRDKIQTLFRKFSQADHSIAQKYGGSGLGLSITKRLVELMGGKIGVRSHKGKGSVFWFSLPYQAPVAEDKKSLENSLKIAPAHFLVVEDNQINQMIVLRFLEKQGHSVTIAPDGESALRIIGEGKKFDMILMDSTLPGKSGIETTREIRKMDPRHAALPIIALTADAMPEHIRDCLAAGMVAHVTKPFASEQLYAVIAEHLKAVRVSPVAAPVKMPVTHFMQAPVLNGKLQEMKEELGEDYMKHVVSSSLDEMRNLIEKASTAYAGKNNDQLRRAVHDLKSVSGYVGLGDTSALCGDIEILCGEEKADSLAAKMKTFLKKAEEDIIFLAKTVNYK